MNGIVVIVLKKKEKKEKDCNHAIIKKQLVQRNAYNRVHTRKEVKAAKATDISRN